MKERPILFSAPMVRAILAGTKTQTRRIVKPQPPFGCRYIINGALSHALCQSIDRPEVWVPPTPRSVDHRLACPYGAPGDRLWVKETWRTYRSLDHCKPTRIRPMPALQFLADNGANVARPDVEEWGRTRVSIHMPRWASRLMLGITDVRVERLPAISDADALAEGVTCDVGGNWANVGYTPREAYRYLWEKIHGPGSWAAAPWVWVISFRRVAL